MEVEPLCHAGREVLSLRQIDRLNDAPKGTAFRAFKRVRDELVEGRDFFRLDARRHAAYIDSLRRQGVVYEATIHLVLITREAYGRMQPHDGS